MQIVNIGSGAVECLRIGRMIERFGDHFLFRVYTKPEVAHCQSQKGNLEHFAGFFAGKQAVLKALGEGWGQGIAWPDIEINYQSESGYRVRLHSKALVQAESRRIDEIKLTVARTRFLATAFALTLMNSAIL